MADRPWRTSVGLVAVLLWSAVIGIPVLSFHLAGNGMMLIDHIHSAVLFVASQVLIYWMAARPLRNPPPAKRADPIPRVTSPFASAAQANQIWNAELVPDNYSSHLPSAPDTQPETEATAISLVQCTVKLIVSNYLGSSQSRIVYVEPGGMQYKLLPGQELEIAATTLRIPATFQIVESDLATQVQAQGAGIAVSAIVLQRTMVH